MLHLEKFVLSLARVVLALIAWIGLSFVGIIFLAVVFMDDATGGLLFICAFFAWLTYYIWWKQVPGDLRNILNYPSYISRINRPGKEHRRRWEDFELERLKFLAKEFNESAGNGNKAESEGKRLLRQFAKYYWVFLPDFPACRELLMHEITHSPVEVSELKTARFGDFPDKLRLEWTVRKEKYSARVYL